MGSGGKEEKDGRPSLADGLKMSAEQEKEKEGEGGVREILPSFATDTTAEASPEKRRRKQV